MVFFFSSASSGLDTDGLESSVAPKGFQVMDPTDL